MYIIVEVEVSCVVSCELLSIKLTLNLEAIFIRVIVGSHVGTLSSLTYHLTPKKYWLLFSPNKLYLTLYVVFLAHNLSLELLNKYFVSRTWILSLSKSKWTGMIIVIHSNSTSNHVISGSVITFLLWFLASANRQSCFKTIQVHIRRKVCI
jgi:hypothetical protein